MEPESTKWELDYIKKVMDKYKTEQYKSYYKNNIYKKNHETDWIFDTFYAHIEGQRKEKERKEEEERLNSLPYYIQYYGNDLPNGDVETYWVVMKGYEAAKHDSNVRTIVRNDNGKFSYLKKSGAWSKNNPIPFTKEETENFTFIILKAVQHV